MGLTYIFIKVDKLIKSTLATAQWSFALKAVCNLQHGVVRYEAANGRRSRGGSSGNVWIAAERIEFPLPLIVPTNTANQDFAAAACALAKAASALPSRDGLLLATRQPSTARVR